MIRVLLVDDSKFMAKQLGIILQEMDFEVVGIGHDGHEGLELFQTLRPDVTLLDVTMPNMDGLECLSRIRECDPDSRVVMLSAIQDQDTIDRCLAQGACNFLQKPIRKNSPADLTRLCTTLEDAVAKVV